MNLSLWADQEDLAGLLIEEPDHEEKCKKVPTGSSHYLLLTYGT